MKHKIKQWIDQNVWDGENRSGAVNHKATFSPDDLQELCEEMLDDVCEGMVLVSTKDLQEQFIKYSGLYYPPYNEHLRVKHFLDKIAVNLEEVSDESR